MTKFQKCIYKHWHLNGRNVYFKLFIMYLCGKTEQTHRFSRLGSASQSLHHRFRVALMNSLDVIWISVPASERLTQTHRALGEKKHH